MARYAGSIPATSTNLTGISMKYLLAVLFVLSSSAFAQSIEFEVGQTNAAYKWTDSHYARISQRWGDNKYAFGIAHTGKQLLTKCPGGKPTCGWGTWEAYRNLYWDVTRYFEVGRYIEFGIGPAIVANTNRFTTAHMNFHLELKLRYKRASIGIHHYSNAGTSPTGYNMGQDAVVIGWRFN